MTKSKTTKEEQLTALPPNVGYETHKYKTILIDPPWQINFNSMASQSKGNQYNMMTVDEIKALPISTLASDVCDLFCWTTHTYLPDTFEILKAWGFKYHITLTWRKRSGLVMFGFRRETEFCIYAYKGEIGVKKDGQSIRTYIEEIPDLFTGESNVHSQKPQILYDYIEAKCKPPRLELFARSKRAGWDAWGNEVECDINLCVS